MVRGCAILTIILGTTYAEDLRTMRYVPATAEAAREWQVSLRDKLAGLMSLDDLIAKGQEIPLEPEVLKTTQHEGYTLQELRLRATAGRTFKAFLAIPDDEPVPQDEAGRPAVVCIHGHGGNRYTPFDSDEGIYKQFGVALAKRGFVVISTDVGQHEIYEEGRTLMGERLWDLMRCVDYLERMDAVDQDRIGCGGLSLGGEMAMWLGAMDTRIKAEVSCGFLTTMDQMEQNHCMCWKFHGLRTLVDYADIYALTAPRALQCQNGRKEPATAFTPDLAQKAMKEILPAYRDFGARNKALLHIHDGGHEIDLNPLLNFLETHLAPI